MSNRIATSRIRIPSSVPITAPRSFERLLRRSYATEPSSSPQPSKEPQTRAGAFYKSFSLPMAKCFLGALFTYQVAYWAWMKLETLEEKKDTEDEIKHLKEELKILVQQKLEVEKAAAAGQVAGQATAEKPAKKGWW